MKLSKKGEYAVRALMALSLNYDTGMMQIHDIVRQEAIPEKFLEQILLLLKNAGFLQSKRGVGGGYFLNRPPHEITLGQVIRLVDGPLAPISCVSKTAHVACAKESVCGLCRVMLDVRNATAEILDHITFADVCNRIRGIAGDKGGAFMYCI